MQTLDCDFIPARDRDAKHLMIVMHGLGDSMEGYRWLPHELNFPWLNYLLVNAPDPYYEGYSWFDIPGDAGPGVKRSYGLLRELLDDQRADGFPTEKTFLFGFSQGCLMTWETGMRYPHRFCGLVGISGAVWDMDKLLSERSAAALEQRILVTHGVFDPMIPFSMAQGQVTRMKQAGVNVEWHEFDKAHTIAGEAELSVIRRFVNAGYKPG